MWRQVFIIFGIIVASAISFLCVIQLVKLKDKEKIECIVDFLKKESNVDDEVFSSVGFYFGHDEDCKEMVRENLNRKFDETKTRQIGSKKFINCLMDHLEYHDVYRSLFLMTEVLDYSKITLKFWRYFEVRDRLQNAREGLKLIEELEAKLCERSQEDSDDDDEGSGVEDLNDRRIRATDDLTKSNLNDDGLFFEL